MAKFNLELPTDIMKDMQKIHDNTEKIFGKMTEAGAKVVERNAKANAPSEIADKITLTRVYRTPSDGGINTKVIVKGYLPFSGNRKEFVRKGGSGKTYSTSKGVPADFVAMVTEYGTSQRYTENGAYRGKISKKPFFRKSFKKDEIESAMMKAQKEASGGLLE